MRVPVKLLGFVFWLLLFNFGRCQVKQNVCRDLSVENGFTHRLPSNENEIFYSCNTGYKTFSGNWWDSVTCSRGSWSEEPRCIPVGECGALPSVDHGKLKQTSHDQGPVEVECDPGFKPTQSLIKCVNGTWETPVCEDVRCKVPPKVENAFITSKPEESYLEGSSVSYVCQKSFSMNGRSTVFCIDGDWEELPTCEEIMCVKNLPANMRSDRHLGPEVSVRPGETITLSCDQEGVELQGQRQISCLANGEWNAPFPKCAGGKCGPPPNVEFADTIEMLKKEYDSEERVEYICFNKYTLVQDPPYTKYLTCENGQWRGTIRCLKPCTVTVDEMDKRGIELQWGGRQKIFSAHHDKITFACQSGKYLTVNELRQICNDGVMILPECE